MKRVYGSETCHSCKELVRELKTKGEPFEYIDVKTLSQSELIDLSHKANSLSLPIVINE